MPFWIQIMQHLRDVTRWPHRACAHTMPKAIQLIFVWPFTRAVDLLYDWISLCKVPRASKFAEQSWSGCSNIQICDVIRVLQSDWPAKILAHGSKMVYNVGSLPDPPSPHVYPERTKCCRGERSGFETRICILSSVSSWVGLSSIIFMPPQRIAVSIL